MNTAVLILKSGIISRTTLELVNISLQLCEHKCPSVVKINNTGTSSKNSSRECFFFKYFQLSLNEFIYELM